MDRHRKKMLKMFCSALGCAVVGVFFGVASLWLFSFLSLYCSAFLLWCGCCERRRAIRIEQESEWWARAREGVKQDPLTPCCLHFSKTGYMHEERICTRRRDEKPKSITQEEQWRIDEIWKEIILHFDDMEYGEEA